MADQPMPPLSLARRVGELDPVDPWAHYARVGRELSDEISARLPAGWDWEGKRALDFGCGAGRVMTAIAGRAEGAELWGCDIDARSIEWMRAQLAPPFHPFLVTEQPCLPQADGFFDLIWAASVFTHLGESWSGWLRELHRVLADDGILVVSFLGKGMWEAIGDGEWDEDRIGMCMLRAGQPWSIGGPTVFHSEWWLRAHWGRAFEVIGIDGGDEPWRHGWVTLRKRSPLPGRDELEQPADDPRELAALQHNVELLHAADRRLRSRSLRMLAMPRVIAGVWWLRRLRSQLARR
jgi:SAM-dependent methyltransferase